MINKDLFGYLSLVFVMLSGVPYIWSILKGKTRPHIFTWLLWFLLSAVAAAAQYIGNAGPGAWATGLSAIFCLFTLILSLSHGDKAITRSDWFALTAALCIFPIWYFSSNVLIAAVLATMIDAIGFFPTIRKSFEKPYDEMIFFVCNQHSEAYCFDFCHCRIFNYHRILSCTYITDEYNLDFCACVTPLCSKNIFNEIGLLKHVRSRLPR